MSAEPPENSQYARATRSKCNAIRFKPSKRSIPEFINDPSNQSAITDEHSTRVELESRLLITRAAKASIDTLATTLLDFSVQAPSLTPMHVDVIRAIAILFNVSFHLHSYRIFVFVRFLIILHTFLVFCKLIYVHRMALLRLSSFFCYRSLPTAA
ncbi:hypothetical protein P692DRAFT_20383399 [Suillus brevipes Sb2]|nr:hypothetical protein P692DRAFT_20383399 [Suillus brevipes Sb2]